MSKYTAEQVERIAEFHEQVRLENVERRDKLADKSADMLRAYAALLRNRASAKAEVTDEMVDIALTAMYGEQFADISGKAEEIFRERMRAALEAVAPMLASAQVPERTSDMTKFVDGLGWVVRLSDVPEYTKRLIEQTRDLLAASPKPETEE